jgi:hypothetical protein
MASSWSPSLRLNLQGTGDNLNLWGAKLNAEAIAMIDEGVAGYVAVPITGDTTLTALNGQTDQSRRAFIKLTGSPAANFTVTTPNVSKLYRVWNATGKIATFTAGGTTVAIDDGDIIDIQCDGTDWTTPGVGGLSWKAYIASVVAGGPGGDVPSPIGNNGKFLTNNGTIPYWDTISALQLSDYSTKILGTQIALAVSL